MNIILKFTNFTERFNKGEISSESLHDEIGALIECVNSTEDGQLVEQAMQQLVKTFGHDNAQQVALLCGSLVEAGYSPDYVIDDFITFFVQLIEHVQPFIDACESILSDEEKLAQFDEDEDPLEALKLQWQSQYPEAIQAFNLIDDYYLCGISLFSANSEAFELGRRHLAHLINYSHYCVGFEWLARLFLTLFDAPMLVINLANKKGFVGKMSGITSNFQLNTLLMSLSEINEKVTINEQALAVTTGDVSEQTSDEIIIGQWDLCEWTCLPYRDSDEFLEKSPHWIWNEGIPYDIAEYEGYRVILLDAPSYERSFEAQRDFQLLTASISIDAELTTSQVDSWLIRFSHSSQE